MKKIIYLLASFLLICSCGQTNKNKKSAETINLGNGIYYWKTVFSLSDWDKEFIRKNEIKRLYIKLFDVDYDYKKQMPVPIATTIFKEKTPKNIEIIPVVYITTNSLSRISECDSLFYKRIVAMSKRNGFDNFKELQLDCDWTESDEKTFFSFCEKIKNMAHSDDRKVSATIRLHQLRSNVPPVDRGVLMLYNTGSIYNYKTKNSILDPKDVKPYFYSRIDYKLPLSLAFPTYSWGILFNNSDFQNILHKKDYSDSSYYKHIYNNIYRVLKEHPVDDILIKKSQYIRWEKSNIADILEVKALANKYLPKSAGNIIYSLDSLNLSYYSQNDINNILR